MNVTWPGGLRLVVGVVVIILAVLGLLGILPLTPQLVFGLFLAIAVALLV